MIAHSTASYEKQFIISSVALFRKHCGTFERFSKGKLLSINIEQLFAEGEVNIVD